eukprot:TRINITY_DN11524_c0_g1_i1.p1 TRINITY_DN11524_c0_g1~~TRINITY_DN11524_c0_g1_i1.p1  ORF type:complete len:431 (+),score=90.95 TRINITY_DN11524_c0_g1_i1:274-1566(+)
MRQCIWYVAVPMHRTQTLRDGYEAAAPVVDALGVVCPDTTDLNALRRRLQVKPDSQAKHLQVIAGPSAVSLLTRFFESRRLQYLTSVFFDSKKLTVRGAAEKAANYAFKESRKHEGAPSSLTPKKRKWDDDEAPVPETHAVGFEYGLLLQRFEYYTPCDFSFGGWAAGSHEEPYLCLARDKEILKYGSNVSDEGYISAYQGSYITEVANISSEFTLVGSVDGTVKLWSSLLQPVASYVHIDTSVLSLKSSFAAPSIFAVGTTEAQIAVWSTERVEAPVRLFNLSPGTYTSCLDFSPEATTLFSADRCIRIWDLRMSKIAHTIQVPGEVTCLAAASQDKVVAGLDDAAFAVADIRADRVKVMPLAVTPVSLAKHRTRNTIAIACAADTAEPEVVLWDVDSGAETTHALSAAPFVATWVDGDVLVCGAVFEC